MENNAKIMAADMVRKYKQLESTRLAALHDGDRLAYNKARAHFQPYGLQSVTH